MLRSQGTPTHCGSSIMAEHRQPVRVTARARQPQISHRTTSCRLRSRSQSDWPDTWIRSLGATAPLPKMRWRMTASGRKLRAGTPPKKGGGRRMGEEPPAFISAKRHPPQTTRKRFHRTHGPHVPRRCRLTYRRLPTCARSAHVARTRIALGDPVSISRAQAAAGRVCGNRLVRRRRTSAHSTWLIAFVQSIAT